MFDIAPSNLLITPFRVAGHRKRLQEVSSAMESTDKMVLNKRILARRASLRAGQEIKATNELIGVILDEIIAAVAAGDAIKLSGFGTFEPRERAARTARNPQTGESVPVAARTAPVFRPSSAFRARVAEAARERTAEDD